MNDQIHSSNRGSVHPTGARVGAGFDRCARRNRPRCAGRRATGRGGPRELAGADGRTHDRDDERQGAAALPRVPPGIYELDIELEGFSSFHVGGIRIAAGATIKKNAVLKLDVRVS
jgi:hypothetical protein